MDYIKRAALCKLATKGIVPSHYKRYIDDILFGPIKYNPSVHTVILDSFNSIHPSIQFTLENPKPAEFLPFLDLEIRVLMNKVDYRWYNKPFHSGNVMAQNTMQPYHVKRNVLINTFRCINSHSSSTDNYVAKVNIAKNNFIQAGYSLSEVASAELIALTSGCRPKPTVFNADNKMSILKLPFINMHTNKKIKAKIKSSNLPIKFVSIPGPSISSIFKPRITASLNNCLCTICSNYDKITCKMTNLVYEFCCKQCNKTYIGKTTRTLGERYAEHSASIQGYNTKSALAEHLQSCHPSSSNDIRQFSLTILKRCRSSNSTAIFESLLIRDFKPELNRKHECSLII